MEKTIQRMKDSGLFDSLVKNIFFKDMPKEAVAVALDSICEVDEDFENTFFSDLHELGMGVIWDALCCGVESFQEAKNTEQVQEQKTDVVITPDNFEQVLFNKMFDVVIRKFESMIDEIVANALRTNE